MENIKKETNKIKIKICGITKQEELDMLIENQIDYAGFVMFYPKSKRNLTCENAAFLAAMLKQKMPDIQCVAVVVSPDIEQVRQIQQSGFDVIQIHGQLDEDVYEQITLPIFRAFHITKEDSTQIFYQILHLDKIKGLVLDGEKPGAGQPFDWEMFQDFHIKDREFILAGGLGAENVAQAIGICHPDAVDVSSKVEGEYGKDAHKVRAFVQAVRSAVLDEKEKKGKNKHGQEHEEK